MGPQGAEAHHEGHHLGSLTSESVVPAPGDLNWPPRSAPGSISYTHPTRHGDGVGV